MATETNLSARVTTATSSPTKVHSPIHLMIENLLRNSLILREEWEALSAEARERLQAQANLDSLLNQLAAEKLLTKYQVQRIREGNTLGMLIANYRLLDRLGAGGMGVVFKAEHIYLRRTVAIKVLPNPFEEDLEALARFLSEIRSVARLQHPNIVAALDAGRTRGSDMEPHNWYYLVMEFVDGFNLEQHVARNGPMPLALACDVICQVSSGLAEAHQHKLLHRDIKPSNIVLTPQGQAKLLDFGLAHREEDRRLTRDGLVLGSLDYLSPEQALAQNHIDHRADLYALGGVLCWCLTGQPPFPNRGTDLETLMARPNEEPPSLRALRPELPPELDTVIERLMAPHPEARFPSAQAVMNALLPFLEGASRPRPLPALADEARRRAPAAAMTAAPRVHQILIVDDDIVSRHLCRRLIEMEGLACEEVAGADEALEMLKAKTFDLMLLDIQMPQVTGEELLRRLRAQPPSANLKIFMLSGEVSPDEMAKLLSAGADDYLAKPPSAVQFMARIKAGLALKDAQDRTDQLNRSLLAINAELERNLKTSAGDLVQSRNALLLSLAELAEVRSSQPAAHLARLQRYCRLLAEEAAALPGFASQIDANFIDMLECCAPLHDIGQAALPDHILGKSGKFETEERLIMQTHTTIGADLLQRIACRHCSALAVLQVASDIARYHHEAWDGSGYPDRLAGPAIPLSARIVAVADVYDALRCRRPHRPALSHLFAVELMTRGMPGRFDPQLLRTFQQCAGQFDQIFRDTPGPSA